MKKILCSVILGFFLISQGFAATITKTSCKTYPFLKQGFNISDYQKCRALLQQCPKNGIFPEESCVEKLSQEKSECQQFNQLAQVVHMPISSLRAEAVATFTVIDKMFGADAQDQYYLITPTGCLIDTQIDPRKLSESLKKKYKKDDFIFVNTQKPVYLTDRNGAHNFVVSFQIAKNCLACARLGHFSINFNFNKAGQLQKISLVKYVGKKTQLMHTAVLH